MQAPGMSLSESESDENSVSSIPPRTGSPREPTVHRNRLVRFRLIKPHEISLFRTRVCRPVYIICPAFVSMADCTNYFMKITEKYRGTNHNRSTSAVLL